MRILLSIILISVLSNACDNSQTESNNTNEVKQLWDEMMVIHDEVMPKTSEIVRLQKQLREKEDTEAIVQELASAEEAMWNWMNGLKQYDKIEQMDKTEAIDYLKGSKAEIEKVSQQMMEAIEEGKAKLE
ncbi:MAG: hypothetical protein AAGG68_07550 [Bacteroidota bacterium]